MNTLDATNTQVLKYLIAYGIDEFIAEEPVNRFKQPVISKPTASKPAVPERTLECVQSLADLATFLQQQENFCDLQRTARHTILGEGNPSSSLVVLTGIPGADEDREGKAIAGENRILLSRMLLAIGLKLEDVFLVPALPWRPPGNREASPKEIASCLPILQKQLSLSAAKVLLSLGSFPAQILSNTQESLLKLRLNDKQCTLSDNRSLIIQTTYHPQFLINTPTHKRKAWEDLLRLKHSLEGSV